MAAAAAPVLVACCGGAHEVRPAAPGGPRPAPAATGPAFSVGAPAGGVQGAPQQAEPAALPTMKPVVASAMIQELASLGVDLERPPLLNKLSPDTIRKVMPSFARSLGVKCVACHDADDYKAPTPKKKIAARMWNELVVGMTLADRAPLYCDSCHGGRAQPLERRDSRALSAWMQANYVNELRRADGKPHSCERCHGDPFEPKILAAWAKSR